MFHESNTPFRIYHGSTNSTRQSPRRHDNIVDISALNRVLKIDASGEKKTAFVEPNVPMDKLVARTLEMGLIPPVVMEFPGITAGGGFAGTSGESSSFRHGLFDRTVRAVEIILGDGQITTASQDDVETSELFWAAAASFGTMGVVTLLALELIDAKPFVELRYLKVGGVQGAVQRFEEETRKGDLDYIDGILFAKDLGVVCLGKLTDSVPEHGSELKTFSKPWDDWFYINAEKMLTSPTQDTWVEHIPIQDYLFRYERGAFWIGKYTYRYFAVPLNRFTRWLLDTYTHTREMYSALHHSGLSSKYIIQDVAMPYENTSEFVEYLDEKFCNYPLWLCPLRLRGKSPSSGYGLLANAPEKQVDEKLDNAITTQNPEMMLNFGVWGPGPSNDNDFVEWNKTFEQKIQALGGQKWLYANTYYTEEDFWKAYGNREHYDSLRAKYHASSLPRIYDKVKVKEEELEEQSWTMWLYLMFWSIWPLAGLYGWLLCILNDEYLLPQKQTWGLKLGMKVSRKDGNSVTIVRCKEKSGGARR